MIYFLFIIPIWPMNIRKSKILVLVRDILSSHGRVKGAHFDRERLAQRPLSFSLPHAPNPHEN